MLLEKIKADLKNAMLKKNEDIKNALRMVLGEVPRLNKKANESVSDKEIQGIISKLVKSEKMVLAASGIDEDTSAYISILETYLPKMMSEEEITQWIVQNLDMTRYNPKILAMKVIMKELKGKADGNLVKNILTSDKV